MTQRTPTLIAWAAIRRTWWISPLALPIILAACGQNGTSTY